jgi:amino acid adenylation domain-containing protein
VLPGTLVRDVRELARREGATVYMVLLAAFETVLWRYTGQEDFAVGSPVSSRAQTATEGLLGLFLEPVALRARLHGALAFQELVGRVRSELLDAWAYRTVPFEQVVEAVRPERDPGRTPVFQVFFNLLDVRAMRPALEGLEVEPLERPEPPAAYDLTLHALERPGGGLELALLFDRDLFEEVQAEALLGHLEALLEQAVEAPERPLGTLRLEPVVRPRGPGPVLGHPPEGFVGFGPEALERSLAERFEDMVDRHPEHVAVSGRGARVTYAELDARANRVAAELVKRLPGGGERVALLLGHDADMVAGILGVLKAGKVYVPLDGGFPDRRLAFLTRDAGAQALVTRGEGVERARAVAPPGCDVLDMDALEDAPRPRVPAPVDAYILYTSGSTGEPKGVVQSQRNVLAHLRHYSNRLFLGPSDRLSLLSPYTFDAAVMDILGAVLNGATLCPLDVRTGELPVLARRLREERVTVFHATPTLYRYLVEQLGPGERLPDVRRVVLGGEAVVRQDVEAFRRCFAPDCVFVNGLGPTESTLALQFFLDGGTQLTRDAVPVGAPVDGMEVVLRNGAGEQVAPYGTGELILRGEHVARGYWNRPELTAKAFSGEGPLREYRTGDWGRLLPDGTLEFAGRRDAQVKLRGHRVELGEIETQLRACAGGAEALVLASDTPEGTRLAAFVVRPRGAPGPTGAELRTHLGEVLPGYMVPASITFLDAFPLTPTGKVDRQALRALQATEGASGRAPVRARDALEAALVGLWEELLGVRPIGVEDEFFELGGHSLLAIRLLDRVEKRWGRQLPLADFFQGATVARMARLLRESPGGEEDRPRLLALRAAGTKPAFVCVAPPGGRARAHFGRLVRCLDPARPVLALQPPAFGPEASASVEALAAWCRAAVQETLGGAPFHLGGFSNGGIVAFELARQLAQEGQGLPGVALLDTSAPTGSAASERSDTLWLRRFAAHLAQGLAAVRGSDPPPALLQLPEPLPEGDTDTRLRWLLDRARGHAGVAPDTTLAEFREAFTSYRATVLRSAEVVARYAPAPWAGRLLLLRARSRQLGRAEPTLGWEAFTTGPIEVADLPGSHETLLEPPHVPAVAERLDRWLDDSDRVVSRKLVENVSHARGWL